VIGVNRSTIRKPKAKLTGGDDQEREYRSWLRKFSDEHPQMGWRKAHAIARREGWVSNRKRTRRLWREEGLKVPARKVTQRRTGPNRNHRDRGLFPDHMWALDFQTDWTADGRQIRWLNVIDEYTRFSFATLAFRSCLADDLVAALDRIVAEYGVVPERLRMDNGPELIAQVTKDWCVANMVDASYIDPGSPWQNGVCESFNGRFREEFLARDEFLTLTEAQVLADDWRWEYNSYRPHGSLGFVTPLECRTQWLDGQVSLAS
jgi:transposase InsO family protein